MATHLRITEPSKMERPASLQGVAAQIWDQMIDSGEYRSAHAQLLELAAQALADWRAVRDQIGEDWAAIYDGVAQENPLAATEKRMAERVRDLMRDLQRVPAQKKETSKERSLRFA